MSFMRVLQHSKILRVLSRFYVCLCEKSEIIHRCIRFLIINTIASHYVRDPHAYWKRKGKVYYNEEKTTVLDKLRRQNLFFAKNIKRLNPRVLCEVGCGYGRLLKANALVVSSEIVGVDFSLPQLLNAKKYVGSNNVHFVLATAKALPFRNNRFDVTYTCACIMYIPPNEYLPSINEIIRVTRRFVVHDEDLEMSRHYFGYNVMNTYRKMGHKIISCTPTLDAHGCRKFVIARLDKGEQMNMVENPTDSRISDTLG